MSLTQERLKELVHYCPDLGIMWWKARPETSRYAKSWNSSFAGEIVGKRTDNNYARTTIEGEYWFIHRLAWLYMTGEQPPQFIDHANRYTLDNAFENLRSASPRQNQANKAGWGKWKKGVDQCRNGRFRARIRNHGQLEGLGTFDTEDEASAAYEARALELHGQFARAA